MGPVFFQCSAFWGLCFSSVVPLVVQTGFVFMLCFSLLDQGARAHGHVFVQGSFFL